VLVRPVEEPGRPCCSGRRRQAAACGSASGGASAHVLCFDVLFWFTFLPINQIIGVVVPYFPHILQLKKRIRSVEGEIWQIRKKAM
jgi:hypothetical protein